MIKYVLLFFFCSIGTICFAQQSAYKGGQGSGYAQKSTAFTISNNGEVATRFPKPISNFIQVGQSIAFSDSLDKVEVTLTSLSGAAIWTSINGKIVSLPKELNAGYYLLSVYAGTEKKTYKLLVTN